MLDKTTKAIVETGQVLLTDSNFDSHVKLDEIERPTVSVIIPTLNEAKNLPLVLPYLVYTS